MTSARITVAETLELPTWTDKGTATTAEQQEWNRFSGALAAHENGHVAKDVAGFAGAHTAAKAARTVAKANAAVDAIETKVTQANADYDTATDHGRNAGYEAQHEPRPDHQGPAVRELRIRPDGPGRRHDLIERRRATRGGRAARARRRTLAR